MQAAIWKRESIELRFEGDSGTDESRRARPPIRFRQTVFPGMDARRVYEAIGEEGTFRLERSN